MTIKIIVAYIYGLSFFLLNGSEYDKALYVLHHYKGPKIHLLSYPRSGNTWSRYVIESLTMRPTYHPWNPSHKPNLPLGLMFDISLDFNKPPVWKAHNRHEMNFKRPANTSQDFLILILRNPKEAITRHVGKTLTYDLLRPQNSKTKYNPATYFSNLDVYDTWDADRRLLILYEDLILNPKMEFIKILDFLGDSHERLEDFMQNYEKHKKEALGLYTGSQSKGEDILFHSKKMSEELRLQIDQWIEELYPQMWNKYLKNRYSESILTAQNSYRVRQSGAAMPLVAPCFQ